MSEYQKRCEREDEEDRLAALNRRQGNALAVEHMSGPDAVALGVACMLRAVDTGALAGWQISFPERKA
jgi:hypothetical protein